MVFLREQHYAGRLNNDELDDRVGKAYGAVTIGDLERLLADLPRAHPQQYARPRPPQRRSDASSVLIPLGIVALVLGGGPMLIGLALGLAVLVGVAVFAASMVAAPFILVAVLLMALLRRRRTVHWRPRY